MWIYQNNQVKIPPEGYVSFVYLITNLTSGKKYIGKKKFHTYRRKKIKGRKNRKKVINESDWLNYYGSNKELQADVAVNGKQHFKREILNFCKTTGEASYLEAKYQFKYEVLEKPDKWYNSWVQCKVHRTHVAKLNDTKKK